MHVQSFLWPVRLHYITLFIFITLRGHIFPLLGVYTLRGHIFPLLGVYLLLCSVSPIAFGCFGLHYVQNTPIVTLQNNQQYSVSFMFEHDNPGGTYTCFLRDGESCPPVTNNTDCDEGQNITFTNLNPGLWFNCGVRCRFGNTLRTISRSFATPSQPVDCNAMLINDGISFFNYTMEGNATTCFMWSSSGDPTGFECRIDDGTPFECKFSSA